MVQHEYSKSSTARSSPLHKADGRDDRSWALQVSILCNAATQQHGRGGAAAGTARQASRQASCSARPNLHCGVNDGPG